MYLDKVFLKFNLPNTYSRINSTHPLDIFIGLDGRLRKTIFLRAKHQLNPIPKTKAIDTSYSIQDDTWIIGIHLDNEAMEKLFIRVGEDLVETTSTYTDVDFAEKLFVKRYILWRNLFRHSTADMLCENEIQGLIGELWFLKHFLITKYGHHKAIGSWLGYEAAKKDFSIDDTWYEIKTIRTGAKSIKISSIEQLDSDNQGHLVVIELEKMSPEFHDGISINGLSQTIMESLDIDDQEVFSSKLFRCGYSPREEYDSVVFVVKRVNYYLVNYLFPRITKASLPKEIDVIQYELVLKLIDNFSEEKDEIR